MTIKVKRDLAIVILIAALALAVRLPGLGDFMTVDEQTWMIRSADFYKELAAKDIAGTFMSTHPGATVMWVVGGGITIQEARLGFDIDTSNIIHFRKAALFPLVLLLSALIGLTAYFLYKLVGRKTALVAGLLLAVDPYIIGMHQITHLDALQGMFMLTALLSWLVYLKKPSTSTLIATGILTGMSLATKIILGIWLFPVYVLIIFVSYRHTSLSKWQAVIKIFAIIAAIAFLTLALLWPALLTKADFQLGYIARDTKTVITDEHIALSASPNPIHPATFYLRTILGRTTPFTQILVLGAAYLFIKLLLIRFRDKSKKVAPPPIAWLFVYAIGFLILITLAAKKADRYAMPALVTFPILAGYTAVTGWDIIRQRLHLKPNASRIIVSILILALIALPVLAAPYNIAYNNPLFPNIRPLSQQGWGEGLDAAAAWLNEHPLGENLNVATWYVRVTATYLNGQAYSLSSREDPRISHVITYRNMGGRAGDTRASDVLDEFKDQIPVHTVYINNQPYVWIYRKYNVSHFTEHTGELLPNMEVGQTVTPTQDNWRQLDIGFATFSSRLNTSDVTLHIRDSIYASEDLRTITVNAAAIKDNDWYVFTFETLPDSAHHQYYVFLTSDNASPGNAVSVRFSNVDILNGNMYLRRRSLKEGEQSEDFTKTGDIAYQLLTPN